MRRAPLSVLGLLLVTGLVSSPVHSQELKDLYFGEALYYAHQGLYFEALGDAGAALEHIEIAASDRYSRVGGYMHMVARVHLRILQGP